MRNDSARTAPDVDWKVANYYQKYLPSASALCAPTRYPGAFVQDSGRLVYGASTSQGYDTQVWRPEKGWPGVGTKVRFGDVQFSPEMIGRSLQPLGGTVPFFTRPDKDGAGSASFFSSVEFVNPVTFRYTYMVAVKAGEPVQVLWAVIKDASDIPEDELRDFHLSSKTPLRLGKERTVKFTVTSSSPPKWAIGSVVIRDAKGGIVAKGTASSYGPMSGTIADPE